MNLLRLSDEELIDEYYKCKIEAFSELFYKRRLKKYYNYCRSKSIQKADINIIISDSSLALHKRLDIPKKDKKGIKNIEGLIFITIRNKTYNFFKNKNYKHYPLTNLVDIYKVVSSPSNFELIDEIIESLYVKLKKILGDKEYKYFYMRYHDDMTLDEIVELTGHKKDNISAGLSNARKKVKKTNEFANFKQQI